jgi:sugar lactone lactonase YvrE
MARLRALGGVAFDDGSNLVIADAQNNRIRVIAASGGTFYGQAMTAGDIYTVAGSGALGFAGDGGPATAASLDGPIAVAVDGAGNLVIADRFNNRIRVVAVTSGTFYGQAMTAGDIYTVAGNGTYGLAGNGGPAASAEFRHPASVAVDPAGNIVIADTYNHEIRVVAATQGTFYGVAMTDGDIYAVAGKGRSHFSGDGGVSTNASLARPKGIAVDQNGNLVVADTGNQRIRVIAATTGTFYGEAMTAGHIYTVAGRGVSGYAGDSGPATSAHMSLPVTVDVTPSGSIAFIDSGNLRLRTVSSG